MDYIMLFYMISAILISTWLAKKATLKNRGYDIERSLRVQLIEGLVKIVIFSCIPICMICYKWKFNEWTSLAIMLMQFIAVMLFINTDTISKVIRRKPSAILKERYVDRETKDFNEFYSYYKQYIPVFFTWFIRYFVTFFLILIPLIVKYLYSINGAILDPEIKKIMVAIVSILDLPLNFIAIMFMSELDVIFSCYQYRGFRIRAKTMTERLKKEEQTLINDWIEQVRKDEKQL